MMSQSFAVVTRHKGPCLAPRRPRFEPRNDELPRPRVGLGGGGDGHSPAKDVMVNHNQNIFWIVEGLLWVDSMHSPPRVRTGRRLHFLVLLIRI